jgi:predicted nucleic acid-binding protein
VILVDTSVWVHHLRTMDKVLVRLLDIGTVLAHPFVIGELALGNLRQRHLTIRELHALPQATVATDQEVLHFIDRHQLHGISVGYVEAHLLASVSLTTNTMLWTRDKRLQAAAERLRLGWGGRSE